MDGALPTFSLFGDSASTMLTLLVFLATATVAFSIMAWMRVNGEVKRRAAGIKSDLGSGDGGIRDTGMRVAQRLIEYTTRHYSSADTKDMKALRRRLVLAGIFDPRGVAYFFAGRTALAIVLALAMFLFAPLGHGSSFWMLIGVGGIAGYLGPSLYLDRRIKQRKVEYRSGFPDFMDLMVVCADAGLAMEAALDRAGRTLSDALDHLGDRLGLEEARSFATLIQQSNELGSSITEALRVYSDDMRHKRLSRAEEKAYALPAKLSVPMMVCIFPVLFVVILLPVIVRLTVGSF